jgi:hypothetical protein
MLKDERENKKEWREDGYDQNTLFACMKMSLNPLFCTINIC